MFGLWQNQFSQRFPHCNFFPPVVNRLSLTAAHPPRRHQTKVYTVRRKQRKLAVKSCKLLEENTET